MTAHLLLLASIVAGCGDDDPATKQDGAIDGPTLADAAPDAAMFVKTVACPVSPAETVTIAGGYFPMTYTINVNDIVQFETTSTHNVQPHPTMPTDPGLAIGFSQTVCKQFTVAGTFTYRCGVHFFTGTATVQ
jgi:plastocyanin